LGWGRGGGICPALIWKNSDFLVFLPTTFSIFHILPPPLRSRSKCCPPLEKAEMTSLIMRTKIIIIIIFGLKFEVDI